MTRNEAYALLPKGAKLSSNFGYPGENGYVEYFREPDGTRWEITNGEMEFPGLRVPFNWTCRKIGIQ